MFNFFDVLKNNNGFVSWSDEKSVVHNVRLNARYKTILSDFLVIPTSNDDISQVSCTPTLFSNSIQA